RRADRRGLRSADIALAYHVFIAVAREGAGAHGPGHVEITSLRAVWHRRPVGAADPRRLDQRRGLPERREDTAGILIPGERVGALAQRRGADRVRLGLRCLLPRVLRNRALLDADQGFAVGAVEDVDPSRAASFGDPFTRLSVDHRVE